MYIYIYVYICIYCLVPPAAVELIQTPGAPDGFCDSFVQLGREACEAAGPCVWHEASVSSESSSGSIGNESNASNGSNVSRSSSNCTGDPARFWTTEGLGASATVNSNIPLYIDINKSDITKYKYIFNYIHKTHFWQVLNPRSVHTVPQFISKRAPRGGAAHF